MLVRAVAGILALVLLAACGAFPASSDIPQGAKGIVHTYALVGPTGDRRPGERLSMVWKATATNERSDAPPHAQLCSGFAGPYPTVEELKRDTAQARTCPVSGARVVVVSAVADADPARADDVAQELVLPASLAPGFYQLVSVRVAGSGDSASGAGIIRIVVP